MDTNKKPESKKKRFESNNRYFSICIYAVATFTICLIIFKFINNWKEARTYTSSILSTLSPFLIAFLIAYFINPLVNNIDKFLFSQTLKDRFSKLHKFLSLLLAYIIVIGFIVLILTFVIPQIIDSIMQLIRQSSMMYDTIADTINMLSQRYPDIDFNYIQSLVDEALPDAINYVQKLMTDIVPIIYNASVSIISWVVNVILAFVISCYLMTDKHRLIHGLKRIGYAFFSQETAYKLLVTARECNRIFSQYIIGKAIDSLIIGILCFILMCILRLQYALLISIVVGVTNMIPYFGPFIGAIPGILILLIISPKSALIFLVLILALQQFDGAILGPKILGDSTGLQPIWIIFAITVGGSIGGVIGMFLGVPVIAVLVYLLNNLFDYLLYKKRIHADLSNVDIPDINPKNVFIPKEFAEQHDTAEPAEQTAAEGTKETLHELAEKVAKVIKKNTEEDNHSDK